ncbi:MAG: high-affinity branched-chain amino acid ABC transporter ATP-binding protein LivG, partial [Candidatus Rokuibacteriota bacterium]
MLEVERVSKSFGALAALVDVSLTVRAGEVFSVIGPNGAGKSTLFNVIAGLHVPSAGRIVLMGEEITARRPEAINRRG